MVKFCKKFSVCFCFFVLVVSASYAEQAPDSNASVSVCEHVDLKWLNQQAPIPTPNRLISKRNAFGLCEVVLSINGELVPIYAGPGWIIAGELFSNRRQITQVTLEGLKDVQREEQQRAEQRKMLQEKQELQFMKENLSVMENMIAFSIGSEEAEKMVFLVTDPMCPHCSNAIRGAVEFEKMYAGKVRFNVVITSIFESSRDAAGFLICNEFQVEDYLKIVSDGNYKGVSSCRKSRAVLENAAAFFPKFGIRGVPAFISGDAEWKVEGGNFQLLKEKLGF